MAILVLGPPMVRSRRPVRRMARILLGVFALRPNRPLTVEWLIDSLWPAKAPASAAANVRSHIAELRRLLAGDRPAIETLGDGYMLVTPPDGVDALWFRHLVTESRRLSGPEAADSLTQAAALWRGEVLEGVPIPAPVQAEAVVLDDLRICAIEELVDIRLALGHEQDLIPLLKGLVVEHPLRERLWHQLLLALWATGRRSEVIDTYRKLVSLLDRELGVRPAEASTRLNEMARRR
ncbi:DNA-binding SARP family transcriptional activator [Kibdelosporangium banguiense]|uniref:DNA-binding SARP family transcriptional activator n=1 Tax=Kibdelosporangium banguiense TaxID=1365924 RepID=A0ABS4TSL7_9PSEU|nr:AfsR/SARP family transcriptional regulator [Kibdelosporangium banguiense]MBP2327387.1 DNA-binding SARP family transcriptional activator [Kibdelosporangium banguiense]